MSPVIRISQPSYERLKSLAEPFNDKPASVIERLLDAYDRKQETTSGLPKTSNSASEKTSKRRGNNPDTLDQVIQVCELVWQKGKTYQEAITIVSKLVGVEPNTVRDKCTRLISIKGVIKVDTALFLQYLDDKQRMAKHLLRKFPRYSQIIESRILYKKNGNDNIVNGDVDSMTHLSEMWDVMKKHMPIDQIFSLDEIYSIVEKHCDLDKEDFDPQAPGSLIPKWKRNVRNVLQKKNDIEVLRVGRGLYKRI